MSDQLPLISAESDDALFLNPDQLREQKRYTATTVEKIELKRNYILDLVACGLPAEIVAKKTKSSSRTVKLLAAKYAQVIANNIPEFARALRSKAARWTVLADGKAEDAKFSELMVGVGIAVQRAQEMELAGQSAGDLEAHPIALEDDNPRLIAARKFLAERVKTEALTETNEVNAAPETPNDEALRRGQETPK